MKKNVLSVAFLLASSFAMAQVGIGTTAPDQSALLDLDIANNEPRGLLIPRISLSSITDNSTINKGKVANSLLVFNTTSNDDLQPGFYYWFNTQWIRLIGTDDDELKGFAINEELAVDLATKKLFLKDSLDNIVSVPLEDINILTSLDDLGKGDYTYTDEVGNLSHIKVLDDVINNIDVILNNKFVIEEIYARIAANGQLLNSSDGSINVIGGEKSVLSKTQINIAPGGVINSKLGNEAVTKDKIKGEGVNKVLGTNATGLVDWIDISDDVIGSVVKLKQSITILRDNEDGTFTYFNEKEVDEKGNLIAGAVGVDFNANTLSIDTAQKGIFVFKDKASATPLATINTNANSITFSDNSSITYTNVEDAITNIIERIELLEGQKGKLEGDGILINGQQTLADAVLQDIKLTIEDEAITNAKIKDGAVTADKISSITNLENEDANKVLTTDGEGGVFYKSVDLIFNEKAKPLGVSGPIEVVQGVNEKVVLNPITLNIKSGGITNEYIGDRAVTEDKMSAPTTAAVGSVPALQADNSVKYQSISSIVTENGGDLSSNDNSILINGLSNVDKSVLVDLDLSLNDNAVSTQKVSDFAITPQKMWAGPNKSNYVAVAQVDGSVAYQDVSSVVQGNEFTVDNSLEITGTTDASKALLTPLGLKIKENGIVGTHIESNAVTADKIGSENADRGDVLVSAGSGNSEFAPIKSVIASEIQGDIVGEDGSIKVDNGENVLFGDGTQQTTISILPGGVKGSHIAYQTIETDNIAEGSITATKLNAETSSIPNRVAVADTTGGVAYQALSSDMLTDTGSVTTDDIITIDNGSGVVLADFKLGIGDNTITAAKLNSGNSAQGSVATAGPNGTVSYEPLTTTSITNAATLTTDGIIQANNSNNVDAALLKGVSLNIKAKGIDTAQIADNAIKTAQINDLSVTVDKISSVGAGGNKRVLISGENDAAVWVELGDIISNTSGDLTTDGIISITNQNNNGTGALLKDVNLSINDKSITIDKMSSVNSDTTPNADPNIGPDRVMFTDGNGGFTYRVIPSAMDVGEDLTLGNALSFTSGNGVSSLLSSVAIDVKNSGISNIKIADNAVTVEKMSSTGASQNDVLTSDGNGNVAYKALSSGAFSGNEANLLTDGSITVAANNKALLNETTITLATEGVQNKHLSNLSVTTDKISSKEASSNVGAGSLLVADGAGGTLFNTLESIANSQGKALSSDTSITVGNGAKAVLQAMNIKVANLGIQTGHINSKAVTADKIGSGSLSKGYLLLSDGKGSTTFETVSTAIGDAGKTLSGGDAITVSTGAGAVLQDATVSITDLGVTNQKLANKNITAKKLNSEKNVAGTVLTSLGDGEAQYLPLNQYGKALTADSSIKVNNGTTALLNGASIQVNKLGILTEHIGTKQVSIDKMSSVVNGTDTASNNVLMADGNGGVKFGTVNTATGDLNSSNTIDVTNGEDAVLKDVSLSVKSNSINTTHLISQSVTAAKLGSTKGQLNYIGVTDGNGGVAYKSINEVVAENSGNLTPEGALVISSGTGVNAVNTNVGIKVKDKGIITGLIADNAVTTTQIANNAVTTSKVNNNAVTASKIGSQGATSDSFLMSDGNNGALFKEVKSMMPKFFYMPSLYLDISPSNNGTKDVYQEYITQFGTPKVVNPSAGSNAKLPIIPAKELNFFITYYDEVVFENVSITDSGVLSYKVKTNAVVTGKTFLNIVLEVKN